MPIKRLQRDASFPNIGKLRKGGKRPENGRKPGEDLTYFRFDTEDADAMARFRAAYGDEPDTINVFLPHVSTDENFSAWQEAWLAGGLQHRCDGETCVIWLDKDGTYKQTPKPCPGGCKEVGRLMVIVPELQRFAYVTVETHSVHDIIALTEQLSAVESLRGSLQGIPFILKRRPKEISTPGSDGRRVRREKWLLSIEVDPVWASLQLDAMHRRAIGGPVAESRMIAGPTDDEGNGLIDIDMADVAELDPGDGTLEPEAWDLWSKPDEAYAWAMKIGACDNVHEARNSFKKVVEAHGGSLKESNMADVFRAYYEKQLLKLAEAEPV